MDEIERLLEVSPEASAGYARTEMHYGRLEWLAEHIRRCNYQISPLVAKQILAMLEGTDQSCLFELKAVRRADIPPGKKNDQLRMFRAANMAVEVGRMCKFKRGGLKDAVFKVGKAYGLEAEYVRKQIKPFQQYALDIVEEEEMQARYERGETDFLGRPKSP